LTRKDVVLRRLTLLEQEGVKFVCNTEVGQGPARRSVAEGFRRGDSRDGATKPRDLPIPGREFKGVHFAMEFLTANTKAVLEGQKNGSFIDATGKDVIVIGGGDTGTDCVGTAMRHGCKSRHAGRDHGACLRLQRRGK
jgi:glutamate synthase (NADPH/NADH) small chain